MAELLGTIAGGIAVGEVAVKVGGTLFKLRELWKQIQEVPDTIRELLQEIEIYEPLLDQIESGFNNSNDLETECSPFGKFEASHSRAAMALCRKPLLQLRQLVDELSKDIVSAKKIKRGMHRVKVVLKKEEVKKYQDKLQMAVRLLNVAQQNYLMLTIARPKV